jgi:hypothetical protein
MAVNPPKALPKRATANDIRWQPSIDFDMDGCYNVPAIDASGYVVEGLPHEWVGLASDCRDASDLANNNVYSRQRCNDNGWCVYIYEYAHSLLQTPKKIWERYETSRMPRSFGFSTIHYGFLAT